MTGKQTYKCPLGDCGYSAGTAGSVMGHISAKIDETHQGETGAQYRDAIVPSTAEQAGEQADEQAGNEGGGAPVFPAADTTAEQEHAEQEHAEQAVQQERAEQERADEHAEQCCSDPSIAGSAGEVFRLEDGTVVQLEQGDRICTNCDTIHD